MENRAKLCISDIKGQCSNQQLLQDFYGPRGLWLHSPQAQNSRFNNYNLYRRIDGYFYNQLAARYNLTSQEARENFYYKQLKTASDTVSLVLRNSLPSDYSNVYGLRNEVALFNRPSDRLVRTASKFNDEIEQYEHQRHLFLASIAADIDNKNRQGRPHEQLSEIQDLLNTSLYSRSPQGDWTSDRTIMALHDNQTNEYRGEFGYDLVTGVHIKDHRYQARYVRNIGYVLTQPRIKEDATGVLKAIDKAYTQDGVIDARKDVYDPVGIMFVALGDGPLRPTPELRDKLVEKVMQSLYQYDNSITIVGDNNANNKRSAAGNLGWVRYRVTYPHRPDPLELVFFDGPSFINYNFQVSTSPDSESNNRAHSIYEVVRAQRVFPLLFPEEIYNGGHFEKDLGRLMQAKMDNTVNNLLGARTSNLNNFNQWQGQPL